jgi:hypothetical protein
MFFIMTDFQTAFIFQNHSFITQNTLYFYLCHPNEAKDLYFLVLLIIASLKFNNDCLRNKYDSLKLLIFLSLK